MSLLDTHQESLEGAMAGAEEIMHRQRRRPKRLDGKTENDQVNVSTVPPAQAKAGWDDSEASGDNTIPTMETYEKEQYNKLAEEEDEIPVIPSLRDEVEEVFQRQVADAPDAISTEVQGLKELDDQFMFLPPNVSRFQETKQFIIHNSISIHESRTISFLSN